MVASTTGAPCASVTTAAWRMESAAKTTSISAPGVRLSPPEVLNILHITYATDMVVLRCIK